MVFDPSEHESGYIVFVVILKVRPSHEPDLDHVCTCSITNSPSPVCYTHFRPSCYYSNLIWDYKIAMTDSKGTLLFFSHEVQSNVNHSGFPISSRLGSPFRAKWAAPIFWAQQTRKGNRCTGSFHTDVSYRWFCCIGIYSFQSSFLSTNRSS